MPSFMIFHFTYLFWVNDNFSWIPSKLHNIELASFELEHSTNVEDKTLYELKVGSCGSINDKSNFRWQYSCESKATNVKLKSFSNSPNQLRFVYTHTKSCDQSLDKLSFDAKSSIILKLPNRVATWFGMSKITLNRLGSSDVKRDKAKDNPTLHSS